MSGWPSGLRLSTRIAVSETRCVGSNSSSDSLLYLRTKQQLFSPPNTIFKIPQLKTMASVGSTRLQQTLEFTRSIQEYSVVDSKSYYKL